MGKNTGKLFIFSLIFIFSCFLSTYAQLEDINEQESEIPKETMILYVFEDSSYNFQIGKMDFEGKNKKILTSLGNNWAPSVSPDGSKIVFYSDRDGAANLWLMNYDGTGQIRLTSHADKEDIDLYTRGLISWNEEGDKILFLRNSNLWKIDPSGKSQSAVAGTHDVRSFAFSPDYRTILYAREKTKKHHGFYIMNSDGTDKKQIVKSTLKTAAYDWLNIDKFVYFHNSGLALIAKNGSGYKQIIQVYYPDNQIAAWRKNSSFSDNWIAYLDNRPDNIPNIFIIKPDGKEPKKITERGAHSPVFLKNKEQIVYVEDNDIYITDIPSGAKKRLTHYFRSFSPVIAELTAEKQKKSGG
ncbi:MAG: TolB family protein [bacterium]